MAKVIQITKENKSKLSPCDRFAIEISETLFNDNTLLVEAFEVYKLDKEVWDAKRVLFIKYKDLYTGKRSEDHYPIDSALTAFTLKRMRFENELRGLNGLYIFQ